MAEPSAATRPSEPEDGEPVLTIEGVAGSTLFATPDGIRLCDQSHLSGKSRLWRYDQLDRIRLDAYGPIGVIRATLRAPGGDLPLLLLEPDQITAARRGLEIVWNLMATHRDEANRMSLFSSRRSRSATTAAAPGRANDAAPPEGPVCLQCGMIAAGVDVSFCRRCGLSIGSPPRATAELPSCPICYTTVGDDGRLPSFRPAGPRLDLVVHMSEHDRHPVGDDEFLESLRTGDMIRIERWQAPFDLVRRYLVTGAIDAGRRRSYQHSAVVTAMSQIRRWGANAEIFGDQEEWREARRAVSTLMERYQLSA